MGAVSLNSTQAVPGGQWTNLLLNKQKCSISVKGTSTKVRPFLCLGDVWLLYCSFVRP